MARVSLKKRFTESEKLHMATPAGFAEKILGMNLYPKQKAVLEAMAPEGSAVAFKSCNEGGKTSRIAAAAVLWHLAVIQGKVISTSGAARQIQDQLVPALHRHRSKFPAFQFMKVPKIETENPNVFYAGYTTNEGGKFEGFHEEREFGNEPLLIIVDEAKTVPDYVFEAIERCKANRVLLMSSPGDPSGEFYQAFNKKRDSYGTIISQTAQECPHIKPEWIARMEKKWGREHPLVRSMIYAEFMENIQDSIIKLKALEETLANPPAFNGQISNRKAFCDFAAGGDENVLALREGNRVRIIDAWREKDTMSACGRFATKFHQLGLRATEIECDATGLGKPMMDALCAMGWPIIPVYFTSPSSIEPYANVVAEMWMEGSRKIERNEVILDPDDEDLKGQLLSRKVRCNLSARGKLLLESKDELRRRGVPSPDRADAVMGALAPASGFVSMNFEEVRESWRDDSDREPAMAGFECGFTA